MDLTNFITNDPKELIVRGTYKKILILAIVSTVPCIGILTDSYENWRKAFSESISSAIIMSFLILLAFTFAIYCWVRVFDRKIKLIVNTKGIWHSKMGFVEWPNMWYFHINEERTAKAGTFHYVILKTKLSDKAYKINLTYLDKTYEEVQVAINENSKNFKVHDLGFDSNE